jgi:hypothetical protein
MPTKLILAALFLLFAPASQAEVIFSATSALPSDFGFRDKLVAAVETNCVRETANDYPIVESKTDVNEVKVDQGVVDVLYSSTFDVYGYDADGYHPRRYQVLVESAWYAGSNPTPEDYIEIISVDGCQ